MHIYLFLCGYVFNIFICIWTFVIMFLGPGWYSGLGFDRPCQDWWCIGVRAERWLDRRKQTAAVRVGPMHRQVLSRSKLCLHQKTAIVSRFSRNNPLTKKCEHMISMHFLNCECNTAEAILDKCNNAVMIFVGVHFSQNDQACQVKTVPFSKLRISTNKNAIEH